VRATVDFAPAPLSDDHYWPQGVIQIFSLAEGAKPYLEQPSKVRGCTNEKPRRSGARR